MNKEFDPRQYIVDKATNIISGAFNDNERGSNERRKQANEVQKRIVQETFDTIQHQYELEQAAKEATDKFSAQGDWERASMSSAVSMYHTKRRIESINTLRQLGGYPTPESFFGYKTDAEENLVLYNTWMNNRFPSLVGPDRNEIQLTDGSYSIFTEY